MKSVLLVLALTAMAATAAEAQTVFSFGSGPGQACYLHARFGLNPADGVKNCTLALQDALTTSDRAATYDNRGILLNQQGHFDDALSDFQRAAALRPDLGDAYINIGSILIRRKSYEEALAQIDKGMALGASFPHVAYYDRALALELLGRYKEAYADYKKALEIEPNFSMASERLKDFTVTTVPAKQAS